jgi:hypothetical protein
MPEKAPFHPLIQLVLAGVLAASVACAPDSELTPPPEDEVREALRAVLTAPRPPLEELPLAGADLVDEEVRYREASQAELEALFLPDPAEDVAIEAMQSRFFPTWEALFHRVRDGEAGAPLRADVVPLEGRLHVLVHWWPAMRLPDGSLRPDFRPHPGDGAAPEQHVAVAVRPPWVRLPYPVGYEPRGSRVETPPEE